MRARYLITVLALLGADTPVQSGSISGVVVAVKDGKVIARNDIYVFLERIPRPHGQRKPGTGIRRAIVQKGKQFEPRVLVVPVGADVAFPNAEVKEVHNVFSPTDPIFDLGRYGPDKKGKTHRFEDADEFDIFCDIHPEMWAKVKAVDSPYIVQVADGKFTFTNIPAGKYKAVAWVRNSPEVRSAEIVLAAGATATLPRDLHVQVKTRSGCHDRKDGTPYDAKYGAHPCPTDY
jgi:plastocyanin